MKLEVRVIWATQVEVSLDDGPRLLIAHRLLTTLLVLAWPNGIATPKVWCRAGIGHRVLLWIKLIVLNSLIHMERGGPLFVCCRCHIRAACVQFTSGVYNILSELSCFRVLVWHANNIFIAEVCHYVNPGLLGWNFAHLWADYKRGSVAYLICCFNPIDDWLVWI